MPRHILPATVPFVALAAVLLTACGGTDSDSSDSSTSDGAKAPASAAAAAPLSAAELTSKALTKTDVKGFLVSEPTKEETVTADKVTSKREDCAPLSLSLSGVALDDPKATVQRRATGKKQAPAGAEKDIDAAVDAAFDTTTSVVTLASYADETAAKKALTSIGKSVTACAGGYDFTAMGSTQKVTKVTTGTAPEAGDEAVAFTAAVQQDGMPKPGPMKVTAFRTGTTVTYVSSVNPASLMKGGDFEFPTVLVQTQAKKLG